MTAVALKDENMTQENDSLKLWKALHAAFDYFNKELFENRLDSKRVILNCSRKTNALGFCRYVGWSDGQHDKAEISLNPDYMSGRSIRDIYSTLVHEMCHLEQLLFGKVPKRGYHNKQWAKMMLKVGLKPYNIKEPKKMTGMRCSHTIIPDDVFDQAMKKLPKNCELPYLGLPVVRKKAVQGYVKFVCPHDDCNTVARAKSDAPLMCAIHRVALVVE